MFTRVRNSVQTEGSPDPIPAVILDPLVNDLPGSGDKDGGRDHDGADRGQGVGDLTEIEDLDEKGQQDVISLANQRHGAGFFDLEKTEKNKTSPKVLLTCGKMGLLMKNINCI